eukprot:TRINITY_DN19099_c1_g6_i1.p1 TRINITY_DN19099_c1_g6~~TRINITY_DN19099_c1_g6_i1.p1  ORF type:complete len:441 (+),score=79.25 TRINITY_DN19099_c1_g6_i1:68-1390(+)
MASPRTMSTPPADAMGAIDSRDSDAVGKFAPDTPRSSSAPPSTAAILCACASYLISKSDRYVMSVAVLQMREELNWDREYQGRVMSMFGYGYIATQVLGGVAARTHGPGGVLLGAVAVWSLATIMLPSVAAGNYVVGVCGLRLVLGLGEGMNLPCIFQLLGPLPDRERGRWIAVTHACGTVGQLMALMVCPLLDWRTQFHLFGMLGLLWCVAWRCTYAGMDRPSAEAPPTLPGAAGQGSARPPWHRVLTCAPMWAIVAAHTANNYGLYTLMHWLPTLMHDRFSVPPRMLGVTALPALAHLAATAAAPLVAERMLRVYSRRAVRIACGWVALGIPSLCYLYVPLAPGAGACIAALCISQAADAFTIGSWSAGHGEIAPHCSGVTYGISNTFATVPSITAGPLTVWLLAHGGGWSAVFNVTAVVCILGALLYSKYVRTDPQL